MNDSISPKDVIRDPACSTTKTGTAFYVHAVGTQLADEERMSQ